MENIRKEAETEMKNLVNKGKELAEYAIGAINLASAGVYETREEIRPYFMRFELCFMTLMIMIMSSNTVFASVETAQATVKESIETVVSAVFIVMGGILVVAGLVNGIMAIVAIARSSSSDQPGQASHGSGQVGVALGLLVAGGACFGFMAIALKVIDAVMDIS